ATDDFSVNTEDAQNTVAGIEFIIASLRKAGVPESELQHFKGVVQSVAEATHLETGDSDNHDNTRWVAGNEVLCKKLGKLHIFMVQSTTAVGKPSRCVTLAATDEICQERWHSAIEKALSTDGRVGGASLFKACQLGDIQRVKKLLRKGAPVDCPNAYGCTPLHYAVRAAAERSKLVAQGGKEAEGTTLNQLQAQDTLRVVIYLMSHGADARVPNALGETPLAMAARCTAGFPRARKLLVSILDSSKYSVEGSAIYVVPGEQTHLPSLDEGEEGGLRGLLVDPAPQTVGVGGVTYCRSPQGKRAQVRWGEGKGGVGGRGTRPTYSKTHALERNFTRSTGQRWATSKPVLPLGDHETALGGSDHRLAALFSSSSKLRRDREGRSAGPAHRHPASSPHPRPQSTLAGPGQGEQIGVYFRGYRLGRSSSVPARRALPRPRRTTSPPGPRPNTCPVPKASGGERAGGEGLGEKGGCWNRKGNGGGALRGWGGKCEEGGLHQGVRQGVDGHLHRGPTVSDSEARALISSWIQESVGAGRVPGLGDIAERSGYVSFGGREEIYEALRTVRGRGRGELISANRLREVLCHVGQPLQPEEMEDLLRSGDPEETGYLSCSKLSNLMTSSRLAPLKDGEWLPH
ncbi:unnamed protein product, partial [Discosporangium mesarthrocarpum]